MFVFHVVTTLNKAGREIVPAAGCISTWFKSQYKDEFLIIPFPADITGMVRVCL